jgi:polysaccharide deacetylase family protein (PEP-CTERM system associated)
MMIRNALTIDLEYWYSPELVRGFVVGNKDDLIIEMTKPVLDVLDEFDVSATFFVLGEVAKKHPELVEEVYERGHEIGSHAYSHKTLYELGRDKFENEINLSVQLLQHITKEKPIGFRAPSFSVNNLTGWVFVILEKHGFKYDSSIFPIRTKLYGVPNAPLHIYKPSADDVAKEDPNGKMIEFPMTVFEFGKRIPISGGFYLRAMPFWLLKSLLKKVNRTRAGMIYVHPWETYSKTPILKLPLSSRFITYYGIGSALNKLKGLLKNFDFASVREVLEL